MENSDEHSWWWPIDAIGPHHAERPPDPRLIDPIKAAELRDLFLDPGWTGEGADLAIMRTLFCARVDGRAVSVPIWDVSQDRNALLLPIGEPRFYVTTAIVNLEPYTRSLDATVRLLKNVLPQCGYSLVERPGASPTARLVQEAAQGSGQSARSAPLALLAVLFGELADHPEAAASHRRP